MDITEFEQNLNEKVLPLIKEQLMLAYTNGYKEAEKEWEEMAIAEYKKKHNIGYVIDLNLPSGTICYAKKISFSEILKSDIKLPTEAQIKEFTQCKWDEVASRIYVMGLNGERYFHVHLSEKICLWSQDSWHDDFKSSGWVYDVEKGNFIKNIVFSGEKFWTLLVLPDNLKKDI